MVKRLSYALIALLLLFGSATSTFALCQQYLFVSDGYCSYTCTNTGEWVGIFTGTRYCDYECSDRCNVIRYI